MAGPAAMAARGAGDRAGAGAERLRARRRQRGRSSMRWRCSGRALRDTFRHFVEPTTRGLSRSTAKAVAELGALNRPARAGPDPCARSRPAPRTRACAAPRRALLGARLSCCSRSRAPSPSMSATRTSAGCARCEGHACTLMFPGPHQDLLALLVQHGPRAATGRAKVAAHRARRSGSLPAELVVQFRSRYAAHRPVWSSVEALNIDADQRVPRADARADARGPQARERGDCRSAIQRDWCRSPRHSAASRRARACADSPVAQSAPRFACRMPVAAMSRESRTARRAGCHRA